MDGALLSALTRILVTSVHAFYAKRPRVRGVAGAKTGSLTAVQRTSSDLRLNLHLHTVFLDETYHQDGAALAWQELGHLRTREVGEVLKQAVRRMARYLERLVSISAPDIIQLCIENCDKRQSRPAGRRWVDRGVDFARAWA